MALAEKELDGAEVLLVDMDVLFELISDTVVSMVGCRRIRGTASPGKLTKVYLRRLASLLVVEG